MVIINTTPAIQPAAVNRPAGPAPILPADRLLMAVVLGQKAGHLYELASGNLRLMAESQTPLRQGEQLQLQVTGRDAQQRPLLQILNRADAKLLPLLKATLPQQQGLNQLSSGLITALAQSPQSAPNHALQTGLQQLFAALPRRQQLQEPRGLQQALLNSGLFLEAGLAQGQVGRSDIKAQLLRLAALLSRQHVGSAEGKPATANRPGTEYLPARSSHPHSSHSAPPSRSPAMSAYANSSPPPTSSELPGAIRSQGRLPITRHIDPGQLLNQLQHQVDGALARIQAHQLLSLQSKDDSQRPHIMEIPVVDEDGIDVWQIAVERAPYRDKEQHDAPQDRDHQGDTQHQWRFTLSFDFPALGAIKVTVADTNGTLDIQFTAARPATLALIRRYQSELEEHLEGPCEIHSRCGDTDGPGSPLSSRHLLEDQA